MGDIVYVCTMIGYIAIVIGMIHIIIDLIVRFFFRLYNKKGDDE